MAGGIGPPQDSERRALVGTSSKNPPKDEAWLHELRFVPVQWWACRSRRQGSSMNSLRSPLTPRPARGGRGVRKTDLTTPTPLWTELNSSRNFWAGTPETRNWQVVLR